MRLEDYIVWRGYNQTNGYKDRIEKSLEDYARWGSMKPIMKQKPITFSFSRPVLDVLQQRFSWCTVYDITKFTGMDRSLVYAAVDYLRKRGYEIRKKTISGKVHYLMSTHKSVIIN